MNSFDANEKSLANFAKTMSHPARIRTVALLLENDNRMAFSDLVNLMPLAQSTVSQHLKELVEDKILIIEQEGKTNFYKLDRTQLLHFCKNFQTAMGNAPRD